MSARNQNQKVPNCLTLQCRKLLLRGQKLCQHCQRLLLKQILVMIVRSFYEGAQPVGTAVNRARMSDSTTKATRTLSSRIEVSNNILAPLTPQTRFSDQIASNTVMSIWTPNWWKTPPVQQQLVRPLDSAGSIRSSHRVYRDPTSSQSFSFSTTSITRPECSSFSRNCRSGEERSNSLPVIQPHPRKVGGGDQ